MTNKPLHILTLVTIIYLNTALQIMHYNLYYEYLYYALYFKALSVTKILFIYLFFYIKMSCFIQCVKFTSNF